MAVIPHPRGRAPLPMSPRLDFPLYTHTVLSLETWYSTSCGAGKLPNMKLHARAYHQRRHATLLSTTKTIVKSTEVRIPHPLHYFLLQCSQGPFSSRPLPLPLLHKSLAQMDNVEPTQPATISVALVHGLHSLHPTMHVRMAESCQ